MKKLISFSLYGSHKKYLHGIIEAVVSYKLYFDDSWKIRVYACESLKDHRVIAVLKNFNAEVVFRKQQGKILEKRENNEGMFWRFEPLYDDSDIHCFISRDADSRATAREYKMVNEFLESNEVLHVIHDHRCHSGVMGGMFGVRLTKLKEKKYNIPSCMDYVSKEIKENGCPRRGSDQTWLRNVMSPIIAENGYLLHVCKGNLSGKKIDDITLLGKHKIIDGHYIVTEDAHNFIGRQHHIQSPTDLKLRNQVFLPIQF